MFLLQFRLHSELGYYDHQRLDHRLKNLEIKHKTLKTESKEKSSKNNKLESDLAEAKQEIVSLQKAIQEIQVEFHYFFTFDCSDTEKL